MQGKVKLGMIKWSNTRKGRAKRVKTLQNWTGHGAEQGQVVHDHVKQYPQG